MNRKKITVQLNLLIALLFFTASAFSQKDILLKGVVTNNHSGNPIEKALVTLKNEKTEKVYTTTTDTDGKYQFKNLINGKYYLKIAKENFKKFRKSSIDIKAGKTKTVNAKMLFKVPPPPVIDEIEVVEDNETESIPIQINLERKDIRFSGKAKRGINFNRGSGIGNGIGSGYHTNEPEYHNREGYAAIEENGYKLTTASPRSTFSIDVDAASYSNVRRILLSGVKPDKGAVRVEEMINYFNYDYPNPQEDEPFSITTEIGECPWSNNKLVHIGLQGRRIEKDNLPPSNLVFLLDVSGSMNMPNKLPLLKNSFKMLINELGENDRIAMVVYAGAAGIVLKSTSADNKEEILEALVGLNAGGSTAGGQGIELAYKVAEKNFIKGGNNRVILATDGDFNIGMSSNSAMEDLIVEKRKSGVFLTCLGFGTGNIQDEKMEILADKGNGNYAYIDNLLEAKKVLVTEIGATLITLAKDVKIQVEFNPTIVESYRLIGYENRMLKTEDFNDDKKDAGEIGAGHSVTALYEIVLVGEGNGDTPSVDPLRYQNDTDEAKTKYGKEILTVKFRYKAPDGDVSKLIERNLKNKILKENQLSDNYRFAAAVAGFGMLVRESEYKGTLTFDKVAALAKKSKGEDSFGYRAEFLRLVDAAKTIFQ